MYVIWMRAYIPRMQACRYGIEGDRRKVWMYTCMIWTHTTQGRQMGKISCRHSYAMMSRCTTQCVFNAWIYTRTCAHKCVCFNSTQPPQSRPELKETVELEKDSISISKFRNFEPPKFVIHGIPWDLWSIICQTVRFSTLLDPSSYFYLLKLYLKFLTRGVGAQ